MSLYLLSKEENEPKTDPEKCVCTHIENVLLGDGRVLRVYYLQASSRGSRLQQSTLSCWLESETSEKKISICGAFLSLVW